MQLRPSLIVMTTHATHADTDSHTHCWICRWFCPFRPLEAGPVQLCSVETEQQPQVGGVACRSVAHAAHALQRQHGAPGPEPRSAARPMSQTGCAWPWGWFQRPHHALRVAVGGFLIFIFFISVFYKNIFSIWKFTEIYPAAPLPGGRDLAARLPGGRG